MTETTHTTTPDAIVGVANIYLREERTHLLPVPVTQEMVDAAEAANLSLATYITLHPPVVDELIDEALEARGDHTVDEISVLEEDLSVLTSKDITMGREAYDEAMLHLLEHQPAKRGIVAEPGWRVSLPASDLLNMAEAVECLLDDTAEKLIVAMFEARTQEEIDEVMEVAKGGAILDKLIRKVKAVATPDATPEAEG